MQGDRTVGIHEAPSEAFLARLDSACGIVSPRRHGHDVVGTIAAMEARQVRVLISLGGNFLQAAPDTQRTAEALASCDLTVHIATKLNKSHATPGKASLILPCLARSERDSTGGRDQFVTVENSMGIVHRSQGRLSPASDALRSEPAIVAGLASATLGDENPVPWRWLVEDYDRVRDLVERAIAGFDRYNERVLAPDGFRLPNGPREGRFGTPSGRARFSVVPRMPLSPGDGELVLMTLRSHDQFNTTVYDLDDRYRGVQQERHVVFVRGEDLEAMGIPAHTRVDISSHFEGRTRTVRGFVATPYDLPPGCAAMYFPEGNPLVPLESHAVESRTPTSKAVLVRLSPSTDPRGPLNRDA